MQGTIQLVNPIQINGAEVRELAYDNARITVAQFAEADSMKILSSGAKSGNLAGAPEIDYGFHLYLGIMAVVAVNPGYDVRDLERIHGADVMEVMRIGRNFITGRSAEPSEESGFEEPSGITLAPSTPLSDTSSDEDSSIS